METRTDILNVIYLGTYFLHIQTVMVRSLGWNLTSISLTEICYVLKDYLNSLGNENIDINIESQHRPEINL